MSDYIPQPGDTEVREIIRIVPHAKLDDAVELFVDGLKFRIGTLFDAAKNLRWGQPDSLVGKDPAARQDVHFFVRTRVSEKTFTNDEGQEKHYIDIVAIWGDDEEEPQEDNIVSCKRGSGIRRANGAAAVAPLVEDELRSRINGFADQMMSVLGRLHDHEQRLAKLEGKTPGAALQAANAVLFGDPSSTVVTEPPGDDLFDEGPATTPPTHTLPDMATYAAAAEEIINETGNYRLVRRQRRRLERRQRLKADARFHVGRRVLQGIAGDRLRLAGFGRRGGPYFQPRQHVFDVALAVQLLLQPVAPQRPR
jgi:hypothetical protein